VEQRLGLGQRGKGLFSLPTSQSAVQVCCTIADGKPTVLLTLFKKRRLGLQKKSAAEKKIRLVNLPFFTHFIEMKPVFKVSIVVKIFNNSSFLTSL